MTVREAAAVSEAETPVLSPPPPQTVMFVRCGASKSTAAGDRASAPATVCGGLVAVAGGVGPDVGGGGDDGGDASSGRRFRRLARRLSATLRRSLSSEDESVPPPGRMPNYALRATLFSTECLKDRTQFAEAALQFIRLTAEDADLRSVEVAGRGHLRLVMGHWERGQSGSLGEVISG